MKRLYLMLVTVVNGEFIENKRVKQVWFEIPYEVVHVVGPGPDIELVDHDQV